MDDNFIETGYRPSTQVRDALDENTFKNLSVEDRIHFFKSEGCTIGKEDGIERFGDFRPILRQITTTA